MLKLNVSRFLILDFDKIKMKLGIDRIWRFLNNNNNFEKDTNFYILLHSQLNQNVELK